MFPFSWHILTDRSLFDSYVVPIIFGVLDYFLQLDILLKNTKSALDKWLHIWTN